MDNPQFVQRHYAFTVLHDPEQPENTPQLEIAMSLLHMKYPAEQINFFNEALYAAGDLEAYKNRVCSEQRENYRNKLPSLAVEDTEAPDAEAPEIEYRESSNWRYSESVSIKYPGDKGIVVERVLDTYAGGAHGLQIKRYFVIDLESQRLVKIDDLFADFQGDATRAIVYEELRKHSELEEEQPFTEGIFLNDEPELSFNFFVTQEGVGLRWDPYEIASYSEGGIEIMLPWNKIRPHMLHSGMELLTKFNIYLFVS